MKQIIPFKKELPFKTKVSEITSISLERDIDVSSDGIVSGTFHITGDYKMNEGSINREKFSFDLPFDITLDPRYDVSSVNTDIEDFYYDVINEDTLKVNIDLFVEAEYLQEAFKVDEEEIVDAFDHNEDVSELREVKIEDVNTLEDRNGVIDDLLDEINDVKDEVIDIASGVKEDISEFANDLFSNLDDKETYATYYVYIVKEDDTIDKILTKYGISKEEFEDYNDITDIKVGDKVIIPKISE